MERLTKICYWAARVLCILEILLIGMFALDEFGPGHTIWRQLAGFVIHLIPSIFLAILLLIAWKWEKPGGIILIVAGGAFGWFLMKTGSRHQLNFWGFFTTFMALAFPIILSGILFLVSDYLKNRNSITAGNTPGE